MEQHFNLDFEDSQLSSSLLAFRSGSFGLACLLLSLTDFHSHPKDQKEVKRVVRGVLDQTYTDNEIQNRSTAQETDMP
ncbi:uncharacterized [Tachysurus ichikawai]